MNPILSTSRPKPGAGTSTISGTEVSFRRSEPSWNSAKRIAECYHAIVRDPRYFQFAHIPRRIVRCLERYATVRHSQTVEARLLAYYLFIGVVDDGFESSEFEIGEKVLKRFSNPVPCFDEDTWNSKSQFMAEVLKQHIDPLIHDEVLRKFRDLYRANVAERYVTTRQAYSRHRKLIGSLTAELSYLLIRDCLTSEAIDCCGLMKAVGAVGCLVDSVIDAPADKRAGTLSFRPGWSDLLMLWLTTLLEGMKLVVTHPRMLPLFVDAIRDNFYDRRRSLVT
jgi:hypothetical protein